MQVSLDTLSCPFQPWKPADGRIFSRFAYDTETTDIDHQRPNLTPCYVLGTTYDGHRGVFLPRDRLGAFFAAHRDVPFVCHNAPFDLRVTASLLRPELDLYDAVDRHLVWDTLVLKRLYSLGAVGHTACGNSSLADCAREHLGVTLRKEVEDGQGRQARTGFGQFLGRPPNEIPGEYLTYAAQDALATWHLHAELRRLIDRLLADSADVWGHGGGDWLRDAAARFVPLTHHVQLRAAILMDALSADGIGIDRERAEEKRCKLEELVELYKARLRPRGYLAGEKGSEKALQSIIREVVRANTGIELRTTATGKWGTADEDLAPLAGVDSFFADLQLFKTARKLLSTYVGKLGRPRLYAKFGSLLETGRTYCGGGFNLQNLPRESDEHDAAATVRGCFVPAEGHVFVDSD
jgi:hypothetical protein